VEEPRARDRCPNGRILWRSIGFLGGDGSAARALAPSRWGGLLESEQADEVQCPRAGDERQEDDQPRERAGAATDHRDDQEDVHEAEKRAHTE